MRKKYLFDDDRQTRMQRSQNNTNQRNIVYSKKVKLHSRSFPIILDVFFFTRKIIRLFFPCVLKLQPVHRAAASIYYWILDHPTHTVGVYTESCYYYFALLEFILLLLLLPSLYNNCMRRARKMKKTWPSLSPFYNICLQRTAHTSIWFIWDTQSI